MHQQIFLFIIQLHFIVLSSNNSRNEYEYAVNIDICTIVAKRARSSHVTFSQGSLLPCCKKRFRSIVNLFLHLDILVCIAEDFYLLFIF